MNICATMMKPTNEGVEWARLKSLSALSAPFKLLTLLLTPYSEKSHLQHNSHPRNMFCMYFCCPWGQRREGWCPTRAPRNGPISPLSLGGNTAGVHWHWVCRTPNPSGDKSALCKSLVPGFSRNYQATGELPNCLILSTQLYSKNRHC